MLWSPLLNSLAALENILIHADKFLTMTVTQVYIQLKPDLTKSPETVNHFLNQELRKIGIVILHAVDSINSTSKGRCIPTAIMTS